MFCPVCGKQVNDDCQFCPGCGANLTMYLESLSNPPQPMQSQAAPAQAAPSNAQAQGYASSSNARIAAATTEETAGVAATPTVFAKYKVPIIVATIIIVIEIAVLAFMAVFMTLNDQNSPDKLAETGQPITTVVGKTGVEFSTMERPRLLGDIISEGATTSQMSPALTPFVENSSGTVADAGASGVGESMKVEVVSENVAEGSNAYGSISTPDVASGLQNVVNKDAFDSEVMSHPELVSMLEENLFAVTTGYTDACEFYEIYEPNRYAEKANFVTTDSMLHTYHLFFMKLLKSSEKTSLSDKLTKMSKDLLAEAISQREQLKGSEWEEAARRNIILFGVASYLMDPTTQVPSDVVSEIQSEAELINEANGAGICSITQDKEDYSMYKPRGYYEGDAQLEKYFRAMTWYGRIHFAQKDDGLNRSALLIALALDPEQDGKPNAEWEAIYTITSFFAGESDDCGYYEYFPLVQAAYGNSVTMESLKSNSSAWEDFCSMTAQVRAPQIKDIIAGDEAEVDQDDLKGMRVMGQRFTIDESIFSNLVYDAIPGERVLPDTLDVPAALGSDEALKILDEKGETSYEGYTDNMQELRTSMANQDKSVWEASLYSQWLYMLNPLLISKDESYPEFMTSSLWDRKNLQTYLGSYTELKHDTVLYTKQMMTEMGGGLDTHYDDRGYVEPEPEVFSRLAALSKATSEGLQRFGAISSSDIENLARLEQLATQLSQIATKELKGEEASEDEYELIRSFGGQLEHFWQEANPEVTNTSYSKSREAPAAVVVDVATYNEGQTVLETGTGKVRSIYVLVPIAGELHLCEGAVWSYYEFKQPQSNRLTDSKWREMIGIGEGGYGNTTSVAPVEWSDAFTVSTK